jgi:hypothetical protein
VAFLPESLRHKTKIGIMLTLIIQFFSSFFVNFIISVNKFIYSHSVDLISYDIEILEVLTSTV